MKKTNKILVLLLSLLIVIVSNNYAIAQNDIPLKAKTISNVAANRGKIKDSKEQVKNKDKAIINDSTTKDDSSVIDNSNMDNSFVADTLITPMESEGFHQILKTKFIEGNAGFMSLVALALVIGLAFCIERIIYLSLSEIKTNKFIDEIKQYIEDDKIDLAIKKCSETRGPIASLCCQGLERIDQSIEDIERSVASYGSVQAANLEKGCSWITLFITMAPSLGFLGTVIGMVMSFDQIQIAGDISPTIVASGMKVALLTTIFGIIVAIILQIFYNYILSKIESITADMEESAITILDYIVKYKQNAQNK